MLLIGSIQLCISEMKFGALNFGLSSLIREILERNNLTLAVPILTLERW